MVGSQLMREALHDEPDTLMVVSSYHIGKERAYLGAAAALGLKVGPVTDCCLEQCRPST
jgi:DNA cross-link repair 1A protein